MAPMYHILNFPSASSYHTPSENGAANRDLPLADTSHSLSGTITGVAAFEACYDGRCDDYADQVRAYIRENLGYLTKFLKERLPEVRLIRPDACFVCWLDCRGLGFQSQPELMNFWNGTGVLLSDGLEYDRIGLGKGFVRMAYGFPQSQLKEALDRLAQAVEERRKRV